MDELSDVSPPIPEVRPSPKPKPKKKYKKRRKRKMRTTTTGPLRPEELLPEVIPKAVIPEGVKTARVKLRVDYWPLNPVMDGDRLLAGSVVDLPMDEAKTVVGKRIGELQF